MDNLLVPQSYGPFHYFTTRFNVSLVIVAWLAFLLRLWVRHRYLKHFSKDDWFMAAALILFTAYCALAIVFMYILASGRVALQLKKFSDTYAATVAASFWTNITLKLSLCFFFLRVLNQRWAKYIIILATVLSTVANIAGSLVFLITCGGPRQAVGFLFMGTCASKPTMHSAAFIRAGIWFPTYTNMAVDIVFSLIPIPMLMQTTLDRKQKLTVGFYLALSCVGSVCAIGKLFFSYRKAKAISSYVGIARNFAAFNTGELAAYIIGGCIAAYRPMLMSLGRRISSTLTSQTTRTSRTINGTQMSSTINTTRHSKHRRQSSSLNAIVGVKNPMNRRSLFIATTGTAEYDGDRDFPSPASTTLQKGDGVGVTVKGHSAKSSRDDGAEVRFNLDDQDVAYGQELQRRHAEQEESEVTVAEEAPQIPEPSELSEQAQSRVQSCNGDEIHDEEKGSWPPHPAVRLHE